MKTVKLIPATKDYVWGGSKLRDYNKQSSDDKIAESWELSFHKDGLCKTEDGQNLCDVVSKEDLGTNCLAFDFFPVLTKFIDAKENLSVQVHPNDEFALKNENSYGKTEVWYVVDADEGAGIYWGWEKDITKDEFLQAVENNTLTSLLHFEKVEKGGSYFIPSGTVHAIAKGCLIYEIQQNSNITYRIYDYGRGRQLHLDKALLVSDFSKWKRQEFDEGIIAKCDYFDARVLDVDGSYTTSADEKSFVAFTIVEGKGEIDGQTANAGDSFFTPANTPSIVLSGKMKVITVRV